VAEETVEEADMNLNYDQKTKALRRDAKKGDQICQLSMTSQASGRNGGEDVATLCCW
jgi:hypothetical protein